MHHFNKFEKCYKIYYALNLLSQKSGSTTHVKACFKMHLHSTAYNPTHTVRKKKNLLPSLCPLSKTISPLFSCLFLTPATKNKICQ